MKRVLEKDPRWIKSKRETVCNELANQNHQLKHEPNQELSEPANKQPIVAEETVKSDEQSEHIAKTHRIIQVLIQLSVDKVRTTQELIRERNRDKCPVRNITCNICVKVCKPKKATKKAYRSVLFGE